MAIDLGIPEQPRLRKSPLRVALCQLRFPRILGLSGSDVRPFARAIGEEYPNVSEDQMQSMQVQIGPQGVLQRGEAPKPIFRFESGDGWTVSLTDDFVALETTGYERFRPFAERWLHVLEAAPAKLEIEQENRLGLRYVNELDVGADVAPSTLESILSAATRGALALDPDAEGLFRSWQEVRFRHSEGGCTMQHGYVQNVQEQWVYVLDFDGFREAPRDIAPGEQIKALAQLNHHIFALFKNALTPEAFADLEPEEGETYT